MSTGALQAINIGRISLAVPALFATTARSQRMLHVYMNSAAIHSGSEARDRWNTVLARSSAQDAGAAASEPFLIAPGHVAAWTPGSRATSRLLHSQFERGGSLLEMWMEVDATRVSEVTMLFRALGERYESGGGLGFRLERGCISGMQSRDEQTSLQLIAPGAGAEIRVSTIAVEGVESVDPVESTMLRSQLLQECGAAVTVECNELRTIAGLAGAESRICVESPDGDGSLRYDWSFPGFPGDPHRPRIDFTAVSGAQDRLLLDEAWEAMLRTTGLATGRP